MRAFLFANNFIFRSSYRLTGTNQFDAHSAKMTGRTPLRVHGVGVGLGDAVAVVKPGPILSSSPSSVPLTFL